MYRITENAQYGSREIYFDAKPSTDVIDNLKSLKLRWNPKKKCWYGFASEMVDYFDTNFYWDIDIKACEA